MDEKKILLEMLRALQNDLQGISQQGAGYFSCAPFIDRYNKLAGKAGAIFKGSTLMETFQPIKDTASLDPEEKLKVVQTLLVEVGQLIAYVNTCLTQEPQK